MTTIKIYRNKRNEHKYLEVRNDGHYHNAVRQYIYTPETACVGLTGDGMLHRWRKENLAELLEDYDVVGIGEACFKAWFASVTKAERKWFLRRIRRANKSRRDSLHKYFDCKKGVPFTVYPKFEGHIGLAKGSTIRSCLDHKIIKEVSRELPESESIWGYKSITYVEI